MITGGTRKLMAIMILLTVLILMGVFTGGCGTADKQPGTLVIGIPSSLNLGTNNPVMIQRNANVWETLTELDHTLTPQPKLATSWSVSENGRIWTFTLRNGVHFHDGVPLTAHLVRENILRLHNHSELDYYSVFTNLATVNALDDSTLECVFSRPVVDLPNKLGHYFAGIFSPSSWGPDGKLTAPVGCGPYVYDGSEVGRYDRIRKFTDYYNGSPYFETVEFRIIPDPVVRIMSLIRGDIDLIAHHGGVPANHRGLLYGKPGITLDSLDVAITHYLLFNCARPPFDNPEARKTFDCLLNRSELVSLILAGAGVPAHDYFIEGAGQWDARRFSVKPDTLNITGESLNLLRGKSIVLLASQGDMNSWGYRRVVDYLVDQYARFGIELTVTVLEGGAWQDATREGDFDITLYPLSMPTGTPELFIRRLAYSGGMRVRSIGNTTHYASSVLDSLFNAAIEANTITIQNDLYNVILDMLAREKPVVPLFHERYYFAYRSSLTGVRLDPFLKPDLFTIREAE